MKIDFNGIIPIAIYIFNILLTIIGLVFMKWIHSLVKITKKDIEIMKLENKNDNELLKQKVDTEIEARKDENERHEKSSNILFAKFEKLTDLVNDKLIGILTAISENFKKAT